jgi:hypothetical protein
VHDECISVLESLGGVKGVAKKLSVDLNQGIVANNQAEIDNRVEGYGANVRGAC